MADYQYINSRGVIVPDTADLLAEVEAEFREAFGQDLVTTPETPQGVLIAAEVEARDAVVRNNADLANQINPDIASGIFLDAIWRLTRGSRRPAVRSQITGVVLSGQAGTIVPAGSLAAVEGSGDLFRTTSTVIIGSGGSITVNMEAVEFGPIAAPIGQLVNVATSVLGWETVTNPNAAALGRDQESDIEARRRRRQTLALQGVALPEAIMSRVYAVDGVRSVVFRENVTDTPDTIDGILIPAHSIYVAVQGGLDTPVAQALLETKSLGAGWTGNTSVALIEPFSGQPYTVEFERPASVPVYVRITAKYNGLDGGPIITQAINDYADGRLEGEAGFVIGGNVSRFELAGAVNQSESRIFVTNVETSSDGVTWNAADITIGIDEVANLLGVVAVPA